MKKTPSPLRLKLSGYKRRYLQWRVIALQKTRQDYAFIHIPKCGGTSLISAIGQKTKLHDTAKERQDKLGVTRWNEIYTFSITRHPYERAIFMYGFSKKTHYAVDRVGELDLNDWILATLRDKWKDRIFASRRLAPSKTWVSDKEGKIIVNDTFKLEEIDLAWPIIQQRTGCQGHLARLNASNSGLGRGDLTPSAKRAIQDHFASDFETFGYET